MLPPFQLARPTTLEEALAAVDDDHVPYCGGTELLLAMRAGLHRPLALVDVKRLTELTGVRVDDGHLVIGAAERHMDVAGHPDVRRIFPMLAAVEHAVGNARVRAQGSIGGNLCFAEPKSDIATALIAFGATVRLASTAGEREITVADLIAGPYWADKEPDELMVDIRVPLPDPSLAATYLKYQTMERPTVGVALVHDRAAGWARLVVGAVGEVPMAWTFPDPGEIDPDVIAREIDPTPDLTGSERYKRHITGVYVGRAVAALATGRA